MKIKSQLIFRFIFSFIFFIIGCSKKNEETVKPPNKNEFYWEEGISIEDIPDFPIKGFLEGREVSFGSIVLEKWRGSGDNVMNFSINKPNQPCGYIQNYEGIQILKKGSTMNIGEYIKKNFQDVSDEYEVFYKYKTSNSETIQSSSGWNCAIVIENISDKIASGKIAICFNDTKKSWIAGKFEAIICNN